MATNHPVSAFLTFASRKVFANTLSSWAKGGLGKTFGLRRVRRCLIAGVSLMLGIYLMTTKHCDLIYTSQVRMSRAGSKKRFSLDVGTLSSFAVPHPFFRYPTQQRALNVFLSALGVVLIKGFLIAEAQFTGEPPVQATE